MTLPAAKKPPRLSDQAASRIRHLIANGTYRSGTKLPSEAQLAERLGFARLTLRDALSQLEATGLVDVRHGSGTFVANLDERATFLMLEELLLAGRALTPAECLALMEFREIVIGGFAPLLVERAKPERINALRMLIAEGYAAVGSPGALAAIDFRFNETLAGVSGNVFHTLLLRSVRAMHEYLGAVIFRELRDDEAILGAQSAIVEALANRNRKKLDHALAAYLRGGTRVVAAWLEKAPHAKKDSTAKSKKGRK